MERHGCLIWRKYLAFCENVLSYVVPLYEFDVSLFGFSIV